MPSESDPTRPAPDVVEPGIPATSELPSDVPPGWEADEEPPPLDFPQGVESWGTTSEEERQGEPFALRVRREQGGAQPEEQGFRLVEPGADDGLVDDEPDAVGEMDPAGGDTLAPEESAMRVEDEPAGLNYDPNPGYLDEE